MSEAHKGLVVGIASPSDLAEEREAVRAAVERLNRTIAPTLGFTLSLVMWEDQASGSGRPQALINTRLDATDLLIGLMNRKWGSPTGVYSSGFEEEFERARQRRGTGTHPEIKMYFKKVDAASLEDPGEQLTKILAFKKALQDANDLLYGEFETAGELERDVYDALFLWLNEMSRSAVGTSDGGPPVEAMHYRLAQAVSELPESKKAVFTLHYYEGLTANEIAALLGIDEAGAGEILDDAVRRVGERLALDSLAAEVEPLLAKLEAERAASRDATRLVAPEAAAANPDARTVVPGGTSGAPSETPEVAEPPPLAPTPSSSVSSAVEQLKAWLPDPANHIRVQDLIESEAESVRTHVRQLPIHIDGLNSATLEARTGALLEITRPLLQLVCTGVRYDRDGRHTDTWVAGLQTLLTARPRPVPGEAYQDSLDRLRHYPALLYLRAAGTVAVSRDRDEVLIRLLTEPTWRSPLLADSLITAAQALHEYRLFDRDVLLTYPRFKARWFYPASVLLREDLREVITPFLPDPDEYDRVCDDYEYRVALLTQTTQSEPGAYQAGPGMFIGERSWEWDNLQRPLAEVAFQARADRADDTWPWWQVVGGRSDLPNFLSDLREYLRRMRRFN